MIVVFAPQALRDLAEIADYLAAKSPSGARSVEKAIARSIELLRESPSLGRLNDEGVHQVVVPRYGYLIYYGIDEASGRIQIVTIRHPARDRLFS